LRGRFAATQRGAPLAANLISGGHLSLRFGPGRQRGALLLGAHARRLQKGSGAQSLGGVPRRWRLPAACGSITRLVRIAECHCTQIVHR